MSHWHAANVCRRRYLTREAALHFAKHVFGGLLERSGRALTITQLDSDDQPVIQAPELEPHFARGGDRRPLEICAHTGPHMLWKIGGQRLLRMSLAPGFAHTGVVEPGLDVLDRYQPLSLRTGGHPLPSSNDRDVLTSHCGPAHRLL